MGELYELDITINPIYHLFCVTSKSLIIIRLICFPTDNDDTFYLFDHKMKMIQSVQLCSVPT